MTGERGGGGGGGNEGRVFFPLHLTPRVSHQKHEPSRHAHSPSPTNPHTTMSDAARAAAFISRAAAAHPRIAPALSDLAAAAEGRLWHQVAGGVEALLKEPEMR